MVLWVRPGMAGRREVSVSRPSHHRLTRRGSAHPMATQPRPAYQLVGLEARQIRVTHVALRWYARCLRRRLALAKALGRPDSVARLTDRLSEVLMTRPMIRITSKVLAARPDDRPLPPAAAIRGGITGAS